MSADDDGRSWSRAAGQRYAPDGGPPTVPLEPRQPQRPARRSRLWALVALLALVVALVALGRLADLHLWPSLHNPFAARTVDRSQPVLLRSIQDLSVHKAATGNFQVLVDVEKGSRLVVARIQDDGFAQKVSRLAELARLEKGPALVEGRLCPHAPARILEEARRCRRESGRRRARRGAIGSLLRRLPRALGRVPRAERREAREAIGVGLGRGRETRCLCGGLLGLAGRVGRGAGRVHRGIRNFAGVLDLRSGPDLGRVPLADSLGRLRRLRGETGGFGGGPRRE